MLELQRRTLLQPRFQGRFPAASASCLRLVPLQTLGSALQSDVFRTSPSPLQPRAQPGMGLVWHRVQWFRSIERPGRLQWRECRQRRSTNVQTWQQRDLALAFERALPLHGQTIALVGAADTGGRQCLRRSAQAPRPQHHPQLRHCRPCPYLNRRFRQLHRYSGRRSFQCRQLKSSWWW